MFKKWDRVIINRLCRFDEKEDISCTNNAKNSIVKSLRTRLTEGYGIDSKMVDQILPKKDVVKHIKW